jgi:antitoxin (DNA-binding transcriptional repressor) of toxin-antitoxin stability system
MVAERLTVANLETSLTEVLERVHRGEEFAIERDGEVIASLGPPNIKPTITWGEFVAIYNDLPRPDPGFADDLERIQAEQPPMADPPEWPD